MQIVGRVSFKSTYFVVFNSSDRPIAIVLADRKIREIL